MIIYREDIRVIIYRGGYLLGWLSVYKWSLLFKKKNNNFIIFNLKEKYHMLREDLLKDNTFGESCFLCK